MLFTYFLFFIMHIQPIFETERLILRPFTLADASLILELNRDPEVLKYLHEPVLKDETQATEILRNIILPQYEMKLGRWAMHNKDNNEFIGWCGLKNRPEIKEIDLGYRLKRSVWGQGYATEAASASLKYAFTSLKIEVVTGRAHVNNTASIHVLQKIGMHYCCDEIVDDCPVKTFRAYLTSAAK